MKNTSISHKIGWLVTPISWAKVTGLSSLVALICFCLLVGSVSAQDSIQPLTIGDTIPETLWNMPLEVVNHPEGKEVITLGDYRDKKLIILDFWATYCKPCVASIEKIAEILPELNPVDQAVLIPMQVYDTRDRAISFIDKRQWDVFTVVDDTVWNMQVLIRYLSGFGVAFINDGRLYALPRKKYITQENLQKILLDEDVEMENIQNIKFLTEGEKI